MVLVIDWVPASFLGRSVGVVVVASASSVSSAVGAMFTAWRVEDVHDSLWGVGFVDALDDAVSDVVGFDDLVGWYSIFCGFEILVVELDLDAFDSSG